MVTRHPLCRRFLVLQDLWPRRHGLSGIGARLMADVLHNRGLGDQPTAQQSARTVVAAANGAFLNAKYATHLDKREPVPVNQTDDVAIDWVEFSKHRVQLVILGRVNES